MNAEEKHELDQRPDSPETADFPTAPLLDLSAVEAQAPTPLAFGGDALPGLAGFDMVVSVTEDTVNYQFDELWNNGELPTQLKLEPEDSDLSLVADLGPPRVRFGVPGAPPTSRAVLFTLSFKSGTLTHWARGAKKEIPITNWEFTIKVNLNMVELSKQVREESKMPKVIREHLRNFSDDKFQVKQLYMNFQDANLIEYDKERTRVTMPDGQPANAAVMEKFTRLLASWLVELKGKDYPYALGYTVQDKPAPERQKSVFAPTGATFSLFDQKAPGKSGESCLNFLLMLGKDVPDDPDAGIFPHSWMDTPWAAAAGTSGRMAISTESFNQHYFVGLILAKIRDELGFDQGNKFAWTNPAQLKETMRSEVGRRYPARKNRAQTAYFDPDVAGNFDLFFPQLAARGNGWAIYHYDSTLDLCEGDGRIVGGDTLKVYNEETRVRSCFVYAIGSQQDKITVEAGGMVWERVETYQHELGVLDNWRGGHWSKAPFAFTVTIKAGGTGMLDIDVAFKELKPESKVLGNWWTEINDATVTNTAGEHHQRAATTFTEQAQAFSRSLKHSLENTFKALAARIVLPGSRVFFFKNASLDNGGRLFLDITYKQPH